VRLHTVLIVASLALSLAAGPSRARTGGGDGLIAKNPTDPFRVLVLDGSPTHNVGELLLHTGNWGGFGSWPGSNQPFSDAPSAEWPAGSGTEYLYAGGLWVAAMLNGVPSVSTAGFEIEFRPTPDPIDIVYRSAEGAPGGMRIPSPNADDDGDGEIDEDPLDGHDNDGDGRIDEDFAAISDQMFSRWYTDDSPIATQIYPQHRPLHLMVRENSYQWTDPDFDDIVGFDYEITNIGSSLLRNMYVGWFIDGDVGNRNRDNYWEDDATAYRSVWVQCTKYGPVSFNYSYIYDADGDEGQAPGYFGIAVLGHPTDPTGIDAPSHVGVSTYANFISDYPYGSGGDPTNDFERYELMSSETIERSQYVPRDYRMLVSVGPFRELAPGQTMKFSMALVATPRDSDLENVANAVIAYRGRWFDVDGNPNTGVEGRETPVPGPVEDIVIDPCRPGYDQPIDWLSRDPVWINTDCVREDYYKTHCGYTEADSLVFRTGVAGREHQVHWWLPNQEPYVEPVVAEVRITPRTVNLMSMGDPLVAHLTLPEGYHAADVDGSSLLLDQSIPGTIQTLVSDRELKVRFSRKRLQQAIAPGDVEVTVAGMVAGEPFIAVDHIRAIVGGRPALASGEIPSKLGLSHSPNPFNPSARIVFELPRGGDVAIDIFSADGRRVRHLASGAYPAGRHEAVWSGRDDRGAQVSSGIYFYRLRAGGETLTRKMVLVK
jgi:hypothetical protein